jgi:hypothetical protein
MKYAPAQKKLEIAQDYYDYIMTLQEQHIDLRMWWHSDTEPFGHESNEFWRKNQEKITRTEEIVRRIESMLKA